MSVETFERASRWVTYFAGFVLVYAAVYRLDGNGQAIAFVVGLAAMHLSGYIDGSSKHR